VAVIEIPLLGLVARWEVIKGAIVVSDALLDDTEVQLLIGTAGYHGMGLAD